MAMGHPNSKLPQLILPHGQYWYLATPYTKYPGGREEAFQLAARYAGKLILEGVNVFSPIAHSHPISEWTPIDPLNHDVWLPADYPLLANSSGVLVLQMDTWDTSYGIAQEIKWAREAKKPVAYLRPEVLK